MANDEGWVHPCDRLDEGENPTELLSETALKALTYFGALHGSGISVANVNDDRGAVVSLWEAIANRTASRDEVLVWAEAVAKAICNNLLAARDIKNTGEEARDAPTNPQLPFWQSRGTAHRPMLNHQFAKTPFPLGVTPICCVSIYTNRHTVTPPGR